jgi:flagellar motor switch protein FliG
MSSATIAPPNSSSPAVQRGAALPPSIELTSLATGLRKSAVLLTTVGNEVSAGILRHLNEEEVQEVTREISVLTEVAEQERIAVMKEFLQKSDNPFGPVPGGIEYATSVLVTAFGPETGKRMADRLMRSLGQDMPSLDSLRRADPQLLAKVLHREHPQTIALVLCHLDTANAARLLSALPGNLRAQVTRRMASLDQISPEVINRLARLICSKLRILGELSLESFGGVRAVAELLNRLDSATTEEILSEIAGDDAHLVDTIRQRMFVFEDLVNLGSDALRVLLAKIDRKVLTVALKGTAPPLKKQFTSLMSSRAAEMLIEDMQAMGPMRIRDVKEAQQMIIATARQLQEQGEISLQPAGAEQFVD